MKRVFSSPDIEQVDTIHDLLEEKGIKVVLLNDESDRLPYGGSAVTWPSVWVADNTEAIKAIQIVKAFEDGRGWESRPEDITSHQKWVCNNCGEENDGIYASCWKCGRQDNT